MNFLRSFASVGAGLFLLFGAVTSARAETTPSTASNPAQATSARATDAADASGSAGDYAAREAKSPELAKFQGGEYEHIYIGSSVVVVLLVVLIIVLVI